MAGLSGRSYSITEMQQKKFLEQMIRRRFRNSVKDWDTYNDTAKKMKDAGYKMTASANDTYRVYSNNVTSKWVDGNKISIDDNIMKWVDDSKAQVDAGETGTCDLWSDDWSERLLSTG